VSDPAGSAVYQYPLPRLESTVDEQALPGAQPRQRQGCAFDVTERPGFWCEDACGHDRVLGCDAIAVKTGERVYRIAGGDVGHVRPSRDDDTGQLV